MARKKMIMMKEVAERVKDRYGSGFEDQTNSAESPCHIEWTLLLYHFFQQVVYGLELSESRNVKPAIVCLVRVEFTDARGRSAFERALKEVVLPIGW